jgi:hypothetical protein
MGGAAVIDSLSPPMFAATESANCHRHYTDGLPRTIPCPGLTTDTVTSRGSLAVPRNKELYVLADPPSEYQGDLYLFGGVRVFRYVGQAYGSPEARLRQPVADKERTLKYHWLRKLESLKLGPRIFVVGQHISDLEIDALETQAIAEQNRSACEFRRLGARAGVYGFHHQPALSRDWT